MCQRIGCTCSFLCNVHLIYLQDGKYVSGVNLNTCSKECVISFLPQKGLIYDLFEINHRSFIMTTDDLVPFKKIRNNFNKIEEKLEHFTKVTGIIV